MISIKTNHALKTRSCRGGRLSTSAKKCAQQKSRTKNGSHPPRRPHWRCVLYAATYCIFSARNSRPAIANCCRLLLYAFETRKLAIHKKGLTSTDWLDTPSPTLVALRMGPCSHCLLSVTPACWSKAHSLAHGC